MFKKHNLEFFVIAELSMWKNNMLFPTLLNENRDAAPPPAEPLRPGDIFLIAPTKSTGSHTGERFIILKTKPDA